MNIKAAEIHPKRVENKTFSPEFYGGCIFNYSLLSKKINLLIKRLVGTIKIEPYKICQFYWYEK